MLDDVVFQGFSQQLGKAMAAHPSLIQMYTRYKHAGYVTAAIRARDEFEKRHGATVKSKAAETVKPGK
jgi:hypothetical protein